MIASISFELAASIARGFKVQKPNNIRNDGVFFDETKFLPRDLPGVIKYDLEQGVTMGNTYVQK